MSTTDQALLQQLQYAVIEAPDGGQSWLSGLWTRDEVLAVANQQQDRVIFDTGVVATTAFLVMSAGDALVALPTNWLRTLAVLWSGADGSLRELQRGDSFETDQAIPTWQTTGATPLVYMEDDHPGSLIVRIAPAPDVAGGITLFYVRNAVNTPLTGNGVALILPDELAHAVKYATLARLLSKDGRGRDPARAEYCQQRVDLATQATDLILKGWS